MQWPSGRPYSLHQPGTTQQQQQQQHPHRHQGRSHFLVHTPSLHDSCTHPTEGHPAAAGSTPATMTIKRVCVFCGSKHGVRPGYTEAARALGRVLVSKQIGLVYGGGTVGLMGELALAVQDGLGKDAVLGVIPKALTPREISNELIGDTKIVGDMHERKAMMAAAADAFVAMPGGFGTLEELLEVITWQQLGFHQKPIGLLNTEGFFDPLLKAFDSFIAEGFISPSHKNLLVSSDPEELVGALQAWVPPASNVLADAASRAAAVGQDISGPSQQL